MLTGSQGLPLVVSKQRPYSPSLRPRRQSVFSLSGQGRPPTLCLTPTQCGWGSGPPWGPTATGCLRPSQACFLLIDIMVLLFKQNANFVWVTSQTY